MKTLTHVVLPIAILVALVGLGAYVTQNASVAPVAKSQASANKDQPSVAISGGVLEWDEDLSIDDPKPLLVEYKSHNHRDFWFHNPHSQPVQLSLQRKSCTCTNLEIGTIDMPASHLDAILNKPSLTGWCKLAIAAKFEPLHDFVTPERNTIPGTAEGASPRPYLLRINWEAKKQPGEVAVDKITSEVRAEVENGAESVYPKDVSFVVVPTIGYYPFVLEIGDINHGSSGSTDFHVWSETRDRLTIKGQVVIPTEGSPLEPCGVLSEPVELTPSELKALPQIFGDRFANMRPRCAYRFHVTLFERKGDRQLDMGPVNRKIALDFPPDRFEEKIEETRIPLNAVVKGEVRLINGDKKSRIDLGSYKFDRGKKTVAVLVADDPKVELELERTSSAKLHASLSAPQLIDGQRQWQLEVEMEPNALVGPMPDSTMITLRTKGPAARIMRIPVTGRADR